LCFWQWLRRPLGVLPPVCFICRLALSLYRSIDRTSSLSRPAVSLLRSRGARRWRAQRAFKRRDNVIEKSVAVSEIEAVARNLPHTIKIGRAVHQHGEQAVPSPIEIVLGKVRQQQSQLGNELVLKAIEEFGQDPARHFARVATDSGEQAIEVADQFGSIDMPSDGRKIGREH